MKWLIKLLKKLFSFKRRYNYFKDNIYQNKIPNSMFFENKSKILYK